MVDVGVSRYHGELEIEEGQRAVDYCDIVASHCILTPEVRAGASGAGHTQALCAKGISSCPEGLRQGRQSYCGVQSHRRCRNLRHGRHDMDVDGDSVPDVWLQAPSSRCRLVAARRMARLILDHLVWAMPSAAVSHTFV